MSRGTEKVYEDPVDAVEGPRGALVIRARRADALRMDVHSRGTFGGIEPMFLMTPTSQPVAAGPGALDLIPDATGRAATYAVPRKDLD